LWFLERKIGEDEDSFEKHMKWDWCW